MNNSWLRCQTCEKRTAAVCATCGEPSCPEHSQLFINLSWKNQKMRMCDRCAGDYRMRGLKLEVVKR